MGVNYFNMLMVFVMYISGKLDNLLLKRAMNTLFVLIYVSNIFMLCYLFIAAAITLLDYFILWTKNLKL